MWAASGSKMRVWPSSLDIQIPCVLWLFGRVLTSNLMRYDQMSIGHVQVSRWANITALTLTSSLAGCLHDFAFVLWRQQVKGTFAWENRSYATKQRGLERWRRKPRTQTTGLLLYDLKLLSLYRLVPLLNRVLASLCKYLELCTSVQSCQSASLLYNNTWIEGSCSNAQGTLSVYLRNSFENYRFIPPTINMEPKKWCVVDVFPLPKGPFSCFSR